MVSIEGAKLSVPLVAEIEKLTFAVAQLEAAANAEGGLLTKMELQVVTNGAMQVIKIEDVLNETDSEGILFTIRNVLGTKLQVTNNALAAIE
jgi:hypothetical protein